MKHAILHVTTAILGGGSALAQAGAGAEIAEDIRGIQGPVEIPVPPDWSPWGLVGLGVLALATAVWVIVRLMRRRAAARVLTARDRALAALEEARRLMDPVASRDYAYAVSDALREFIEVRFRLPSTRQTTEEFLRTIAERGSALGPYRATLLEFLGLCDLGKFGKWALDEGSMEAMQGSALAVIKAELAEPERESAHVEVKTAAVNDTQDYGATPAL
jgi:hypothetical protein